MVNTKDTKYRNDITQKMLMRNKIAVNYREAIEDNKLSSNSEAQFKINSENLTTITSKIFTG